MEIGLLVRFFPRSCRAEVDEPSARAERATSGAGFWRPIVRGVIKPLEGAQWIMKACNKMERIQLVLDWHRDMQRKGKRVGQRFNPAMVVSLYQQVAYMRIPLTYMQQEALARVIRGYHIPVLS